MWRPGMPGVALGTSAPSVRTLDGQHGPTPTGGMALPSTPGPRSCAFPERPLTEAGGRGRRSRWAGLGWARPLEGLREVPSALPL